jgi:hypothetical protein
MDLNMGMTDFQTADQLIPILTATVTGGKFFLRDLIPRKFIENVKNPVIPSRSK